MEALIGEALSLQNRQILSQHFIYHPLPLYLFLLLPPLIPHHLLGLVPPSLLPFQGEELLRISIKFWLIPNLCVLIWKNTAPTDHHLAVKRSVLDERFQLISFFRSLENTHNERESGWFACSRAVSQHFSNSEVMQTFLGLDLSTWSHTQRKTHLHHCLRNVEQSESNISMFGVWRSMCEGNNMLPPVYKIISFSSVWGFLHTSVPAVLQRGCRHAVTLRIWFQNISRAIGLLPRNVLSK